MTSPFLGSDDVIECDHPAVAELAGRLRREHAEDVAYARAAYEWVRDRVTHSLDVADPRVTLTASDVLAARTGLCFAKSHLLAALLRAGGIPAGLCYQRLRDGDGQALHGLVAVHLGGAWHRIDPRGNKQGIDAQFSLEQERLAYTIDPRHGEMDYPEVYASPSPEVVRALAGATDAAELCDGGLPSDLGGEEILTG